MVWRVSSCVPTTDYATDGSHSHQHDSHHVTDGSHWYVQCYYDCKSSGTIPYALCDIVVLIHYGESSCIEESSLSLHIY